MKPKKREDCEGRIEPEYDEDSIGAAIDMAFDRVISALNELRSIVKQL